METREQTTHTPGPWLWADAPPMLHNDQITLPDGTVLFEIMNATEADARLIAAAPDLLEAAKTRTRSHMEHYRRSMQPDDMAPVLRAAIAKAESR